MIREVVNRSKINPEDVDAVHLGCTNTAESKDVNAPVIARQALLKAGLPANVISSTIDRACCSGTEAIKRGCDMIRLGEANVVIAGGVETLSRTPHIVRNLRWGAKLSNFMLEDCLIATGYKDYNPVAVDAGEVAVEYGVGREEQDLWAYTSQQRYQVAKEEGKFEEEIITVQITDKNRNMSIFDKDEFPKPNTTLEKLKELSTIYGSPTVTAGNAPGLKTGESFSPGLAGSAIPPSELGHPSLPVSDNYCNGHFAFPVFHPLNRFFLWLRLFPDLLINCLS